MPRFSRADISMALVNRAASPLMKINPREIAFLGLGNLAAKIGPKLILDGKDKKIRGYSPSGRQTSYANTFSSIESTLQNTNLKYVFYMFKPQHWDTALKAQIENALSHHAQRPIIISVLAGLGVKELDCDISCMPNVLSEVGHSYTFANAKESVTEEQKLQFAYDCRHMGPMLWVKDPFDMHLAVACSGSAPAYVMYGMSVAVNFAKLSGIGHAEAIELVINKVKASANLLRNEFASNAIISRKSLYAAAANDQYITFILRAIEAYCVAMQDLGLQQAIANDVAWNTVLGTAELINKRFKENRKLEITDVMAEIMSKGGTTRQAIDVAESATFAIFNSEEQLNKFAYSMLNAAYQRSIAMQKTSKKKSSSLVELSFLAEKSQDENGDSALMNLSILPTAVN